MRKFILLSVIVLALGGCTVGPNYVRPAVDTPASWRMTDAEAKDVADTAWWGQFNDPVLDNLIGSALQENLDLQIASARVDEFAGRYGFVRADLFPVDRLKPEPLRALLKDLRGAARLRRRRARDQEHQRQEKGALQRSTSSPADPGSPRSGPSRGPFCAA